MEYKLKQVLLGTIIGDGCIFKDKKARNYRMNLAHSLKQKEYFIMKYNILKELFKSDYKERTWKDKRTLKFYSEIRVQSKTNELFNEYRRIWYKDGKKIIPEKEIFELDELALAVKYFDDGYFLRGAGCISMNDYDHESINNFRVWLLKKFNITTTLQKGGVVYVPKKEFYKLKKLAIKYATSDVLYKLGELLET